MGRNKKLTFATVLHLSEMYQEQYKEKGYLFSEEQNDAYFRDFVAQYVGGETPVINPDIPLF